MSGKVYEALAKAQAEFPEIPKDKVNPHFKSRYTSLDCMLHCTRPALLKHHLATSFRFVEGGLECVLVLPSGEAISSGPVPVVVSKNDMQGYGSSITYAKRYSYGCVTGISPDEDDDGNAAAGKEPKPAQQKPTPSKPAPKDKSKPSGKPSPAELKACVTPEEVRDLLAKYRAAFPFAGNEKTWDGIYNLTMKLIKDRTGEGSWDSAHAAEVFDDGTLDAIKNDLSLYKQRKELAG